MDLGIAGRLAIVFGASRGLGKAVAQRLGDEGAQVVALARTIDSVEGVAEQIRQRGGNATPLACDVTSKSSIQAMVAQVRSALGAPEIVIYNNGGPADTAFEHATDQEFCDGFVSQVMGFVWVVREVAQDMRNGGWGRLVTLGSIAAKEPHREMPMVIHNVMRPAALGLSKSLSVELGDCGITVNTIGTGLIDGGDENSLRKTVRGQAESLGLSFDELLQSRLDTVPVGRGGQPEEVAALCAYLCSDLAGFMTGQMLVLDGGKVRTLY